MSILIKGMEMTTNCYVCPFCDYVAARCDAVKGKPYTPESRYEKRADFCPLLPIPPHGRLIDADALLARFEKEEKAADEHGRDFSFSFKSGGENCTEWWPVQQMLMDAPTIIPAEPFNDLSKPFKKEGET